jgi:hypothetical protein
MKSTNNKTSTGSTSQDPVIKWHNHLFDWLKIWWPAVCLFITLGIAGITKYIFPNPPIFDFMIYLIKSIGVIMVVLYVIYTRLLADETKKMATASMGLYHSEKGTVLTELNEGSCCYNDLCADAKKVTKEIHLNDKKLLPEEFEELTKQKSLPAIYLKIKNRSARRIDASKIDFNVRHTGSDKVYEAQCNISNSGTIGPWEDNIFFLITAPEGEVEITIVSFDYLDGGVVQRKNIIDNKLVLDRIRKPEKVDNGENGNK